MLEAKEESIRVKNDLDKEVKERRAEIQRSERRVVQKEENLDKKLESIERREAGFGCKGRRDQQTESAGRKASLKSGYRNWKESPD